jgi:hypothetical protein
MKTKKLKFSASLTESIAVYTEGLEETLEANEIDPADCWDLDPEEIEDPDLTWLLGWFAAVAECHNCLPENLAALSTAEPEPKLKLVK